MHETFIKKKEERKQRKQKFVLEKQQTMLKRVAA
jgi:hypothetical protein